MLKISLVIAAFMVATPALAQAPTGDYPPCSETVQDHCTQVPQAKKAMKMRGEQCAKHHADKSCTMHKRKAPKSDHRH